MVCIYDSISSILCFLLHSCCICRIQRCEGRREGSRGSSMTCKGSQPCSCPWKQGHWTGFRSLKIPNRLSRSANKKRFGRRHRVGHSCRTEGKREPNPFPFSWQACPNFKPSPAIAEFPRKSLLELALWEGHPYLYIYTNGAI